MKRFPIALIACGMLCVVAVVTAISLVGGALVRWAVGLELGQATVIVQLSFVGCLVTFLAIAVPVIFTPQQVPGTAGDDENSEGELDAEELAELVADMLVERIEMKEPIRPAKRRR